MNKNNRKILMATVFLGLVAGCSDNVDLTPYCSSTTGDICEPPGFPYVVSAGFRSDACPLAGTCANPVTKTTTILTQPEAGKVCMQGTVVSPDGFAWLILQVSQWNAARDHVVSSFDAKALGITGIQFTVDGPPTGGMNLFATSVIKRVCAVPGDCLDGYTLMTGRRTNLVEVLDRSETVNAPFANFELDDPNQLLDTSALGHFIFEVPPGDYDFCVSNFKYLNADGNEVTPAGVIDASAGDAGDASASDAGDASGEDAGTGG